MHAFRCTPPAPSRSRCMLYTACSTNQDDIAKKIVDAALLADSSDGLGYMEASPFDVGVRGGWRKAGPPHRQRMLRLSAAEPGKTKAFALVDTALCAYPEKGVPARRLVLACSMLFAFLLPCTNSLCFDSSVTLYSHEPRFSSENALC